MKQQEEQNIKDEMTEREDKLEAEFHVQKSPFLAWLDNYWYHYKWHTIVIAFFAIVLTVCVAQMFTRPSYDVNFVYADGYRMNTEEHEAYADLLGRMFTDGDRETSVNVMIYQIYSNKEVEEEQAKAEAESQPFVFNTDYQSQEMSKFHQYTMTGECSVFLVTPQLYETLSSAGRLMPISSLYEGRALPSGVTEDGCGVYISATDFYQYNPTAQILPDDMILCLLKPAIKGQSSKEENYAKEKAFFCAIADYQTKE